MKPAISMITLGVKDLVAATQFYQEGLGWPLSSDSQPTVSFFSLSGIVLGLFPLAELAKDAGVANDGTGFSGVALAHNVASPEEVDRCLAHAEAAGATIIKPGQPVFWGGYSGYFTDLDGYHWEVAHNPFWTLSENGQVELP